MGEMGGVGDNGDGDFSKNLFNLIVHAGDYEFYILSVIACLVFQSTEKVINCLAVFQSK